MEVCFGQAKPVDSFFTQPKLLLRREHSRTCAILMTGLLFGFPSNSKSVDLLPPNKEEWG